MPKKALILSKKS